MSVAAPNNEDREDEALLRAQRAHEPSMEEILASIRAIIADDREPPPAKPGPQIVYSSDQPRVQAPEPTVVWARPTPTAAAAESEPPAPTVVWTRPAEAAIAEPEAEGDAEPLLCEESSGAVAASFDALSASLAAQGLEVAERMAREMLKPMLKSWLDEHLPPMVEKLVRAEISRIARGGR